MVPLTHPVPTAKERYLQAAAAELAKFEKLEREFIAQERHERAAQLRLPLSEARSPKRKDTVA
jgi:hypothetical protein